VTAPPPPPTIVSLSPNPMTGSRNYQTLTVNGSGFQSGAGFALRVWIPGSTQLIQGSSLSATGNQIRALVLVGTAAQVWSVQVVNPNGQASNIASLTVAAGH